MTKAADKYKIITRSYIGNEYKAMGLYQKDATSLAVEGYFPISQIYTPGKWSLGDFIVALILCFIIIGFLAFLYMIIVKPNGTLTVTFELREAQKACPRCAEMVMLAALVCRFCGYEFPPASLAATASLTPDKVKPAALR